MPETKPRAAGLTKRNKNQTTKLTSNEFQTDPRALFPLMPYIKPDWTIWEPAAGATRNLSRWLEWEGHSVISTDILYEDEYHDFLKDEPLPSSGYDCIITNPPYSTKNYWIEQCYDLGKPFALLMPLTALEGEKRQRLYRKYGIDLLLMPKRVDFTTPSGKKGGAWFPVAWFTWKMLPERLIFSS